MFTDKKIVFCRMNIWVLTPKPFTHHPIFKNSNSLLKLYLTLI